MNAKHLNWDRILDLIEQEDGPDPAIQTHLDNCPACASRMAEAMRCINSLASSRSLSRLCTVPDKLIEQTLARLFATDSSAAENAARDLSEAATRIVNEAKRRLEVVVAQLVADSTETVLGVRGTEVATPRMLRYEAKGFAITLSLLEGAGAAPLEIMGQLVPTTAGGRIPDGATAEALVGDQTVEARLSPYGEFTLKQLTTGIREIKIAVGTQEICLPIPPVL